MAKKENKKIEIVLNGPYTVYGAIPLDKVFILPDVNYEKKKINSKWGKANKINTEETYSLCRCGASKNQPFCDGKHIDIKFRGTETAEKDKIMEASKKYVGKNLIMKDKSELCFGAGFCYNKNGNIWDFVESKDSANDSTIIQMSKDCPAGRFVLVDKKTNKVISPNFSQRISIIEEVRKNVSGPLWVRGKIQIISHEKGSYEKRDSVALCRCGASKNKPFCDGTHSIVKWKDGDKSLNG